MWMGFKAGRSADERTRQHVAAATIANVHGDFRAREAVVRLGAQYINRPHSCRHCEGILIDERHEYLDTETAQKLFLVQLAPSLLDARLAMRGGCPLFQHFLDGVDLANCRISEPYYMNGSLNLAIHPVGIMLEFQARLGDRLSGWTQERTLSLKRNVYGNGKTI